MTTHIAFAKQVVAHYEVTMQLEQIKSRFNTFEEQIMTKILNLREQEEALTELLDEHMYAVKLLDKKRVAARLKEVDERKQRDALIVEIEKTNKELADIRQKLQEHNENIKEHKHIKEVIDKVNKEDNMTCVEYIESLMQLNNLLRQSLQTVAVSDEVVGVPVVKEKSAIHIDEFEHHTESHQDLFLGQIQNCVITIFDCLGSIYKKDNIYVKTGMELEFAIGHLKCILEIIQELMNAK